MSVETKSCFIRAQNIERHGFHVDTLAKALKAPLFIHICGTFGGAIYIVIRQPSVHCRSVLRA